MAIIRHKRKCNVCEKFFPKWLINPLVTDSGQTGDVCPLCARGIIRRLHKLPKFEFRTARGRELYEAALKYAKKHFS